MDMDNEEYIREACQGVKAPQSDYSRLSRDGLEINLSASHERAVILCVSLGELQAKFARAEADAAAMRSLVDLIDSNYECPICPEKHGHTENCPLPGVLDGTTGRALLDNLARYEGALRKVANEMLPTSLSYKFRNLARDALGEGG